MAWQFCQAAENASYRFLYAQRDQLFVVGNRSPEDSCFSRSDGTLVSRRFMIEQGCRKYDPLSDVARVTINGACSVTSPMRYVELFIFLHVNIVCDVQSEILLQIQQMKCLQLRLVTCAIMLQISCVLLPISRPTRKINITLETFSRKIL